MRGHVALAAGIRVRLPRAADVVGALEHDEVLDPGLLEADRHAEAGEPAADDRDPDVRRVVAVAAALAPLSVTSSSVSADVMIDPLRPPAGWRAPTAARARASAERQPPGEAVARMRCMPQASIASSSERAEADHAVGGDGDRRVVAPWPRAAAASWSEMNGRTNARGAGTSGAGIAASAGA